MLTKLSVLAFALVAALAAPAAASAADANTCHLGKIAEFPVTMRGSSPIVTATVDGQKLNFILDTGAFFSSMTPEAAAKLGLKAKPVPNLRTEGVNGGADAQTVKASTFALGDYQPHGIEFLLTGPNRFGPDIAGLLGQNLLWVSDVEYDLGSGVIRFFNPHDCGKTPLAYWGGAFSSIDIEAISMRNMAIRGVVQLNGKTMHAVFDTGAGVSIVSTGGAARAGVKVDGQAVRAGGPMTGVFGGAAETWVSPFDAVSIGDETIKKARLWIGRFNGQLEDDMLVGADFFLSHRVYVAKSQNKLYFTYTGGPVFRADTSAVAANPQPAGSSAPEPTDADGYLRRGDADLARRDFARAVEDFSHAVTLDPKNPKPLYERAVARIDARQNAADVAADLEAALKLDPSYVDALLVRGRVRIGAKDQDGARSDLEAAMKAAAKERNLELLVGQIYEEADQHAAAIAVYTAWIAAHPRDAGLAGAYNGRCWSRAAAGQQLDAALADCDTAVKLERAANYFDSRAYTKFRMGRVEEAIADYDAALKLQPKLALSLYGRGVAKIKAGRKVEGQADIDTAKGLAAAIEEQGKKYGLTP